MPADSFIPFIVAATLLNISPGPDHIYILGRTLAQGRLIGFASSWGVCSGAAIHVLAAAFGFSLIIQTSAIAYALLKYLGAAYLVWLGFNALRNKTLCAQNVESGGHRQSLRAAFLQGVMVDVCNPKVALFFLAFLPQFIAPEAPDRELQFIMLGTVVILMGLAWEAVLIFFADRILSGLLKSSRAARYLNYGMGAVFLGLAMHVLFFDDARPGQASSGG